MESRDNKTFGQLNIANKNTVKNVIMTFLPILLFVVIDVIVTLVDTLIIFIGRASSTAVVEKTRSASELLNQSINEPVNLANMQLAKFIVCALVFGLMYYKLIYIHTTEEKLTLHIKHNLLTKLTICLIISGYLAQLIVSGILSLIRPSFEKQFQEYDKLVNSVSGAGMYITMVIAVSIFAPIAEELMFRGIIMGYIKEYLPGAVAIILQALLFGWYHGMIIQSSYAFVLGIFLGLIAYKTKSLIPSIILHASINISLYLVPDIFFIDTTNCIITITVSILILLGIAFIYNKFSQIE